MGADVKSSRQGIDENLHAVLRAHRAGDGRNHGKQDRGMGERPPPHVASEKRKRAITVATSLFHFGRKLSSRLRTLQSAAHALQDLWNARTASAVPQEPAQSTCLGELTAHAVGIDGIYNPPAGTAHSSVPIHASLRVVCNKIQAAARGRSASGCVSGSSNQTDARPQAAMDARPKNATLLPK